MGTICLNVRRAKVEKIYFFRLMHNLSRGKLTPLMKKVLLIMFVAISSMFLAIGCGGGDDAGGGGDKKDGNASGS